MLPVTAYGPTPLLPSLPAFTGAFDLTPMFLLRWQAKVSSACTQIQKNRPPASRRWPVFLDRIWRDYG
jgi:hypothetical protein